MGEATVGLGRAWCGGKQGGGDTNGVGRGGAAEGDEVFRRELSLGIVGGWEELQPRAARRGHVTAVDVLASDRARDEWELRVGSGWIGRRGRRGGGGPLGSRRCRRAGPCGRRWGWAVGGDGGIVRGDELCTSAFQFGAWLPGRLAAGVAAPLDLVLPGPCPNTMIEQRVDEVFVALKWLGIGDGPVWAEVGDVHFVSNVVVLQVHEAVAAMPAGRNSDPTGIWCQARSDFALDIF